MNNLNELLFISLKEFYSCREHINTLLPIINGESPISLRLIDWFVTSFCKHHCSKDDKTLALFYGSYRSQLKAYKKLKFDPFRRRQRIKFYYDNCENGNNENNHIQTTIGQLNFFKWAIATKLLKYIEDNIEHIEKNMNDYHKIHKDQINHVKNEKNKLIKETPKQEPSIKIISRSTVINFC